MNRIGLLIAAGLAMLVVFVEMARIPRATVVLHLYVGLYLAAFVLYVAAFKFAPRVDNRWVLLLILGFALLFRLVWLPVRPTISTDIYRYIWDGRLSAAHVNPYKLVPESPELMSLRNETYHRLEYRDLHSPYLPTSQAVFAFHYLIFGDRFVTLKLMFVLFEAVLVGLILLLLAELELPRSAIILYAWSPLVVTEISGAGHQDIIGVTALVASIYLLIRRRSVVSGALLAVACLVKPFAVPVAPLFVRRGGARLLATAAAAGVALCAPFLSAGANLLAGPMATARDYHRNDEIFYRLDSFFGLFTSDHLHVTGVIVVLVIAAIVLWLSLRREKSAIDTIQGVFIVIGAFFLMNRMIYPWYMVWTIPFLCFIESPGWLLLTGTIGLAYLLPLYHWSPWLRAIEFMPPFALLIYCATRPRKDSSDNG